MPNETMKRGVHAIVFAFFDDSEALSRQAMRRQAELCLSAGVAGVAALGLATEVAKLSFAERCRVIDWTAEDVNRRAALGFTISGQSVAEQVALLRFSEFGNGLTSVRFSSTQAAFEFALAGTTAAVPLPASVLMLLGALGGLGMLSRRGQASAA